MRFLKIAILLLIVGVLGWYFFLRKHHHQITFTTPLPKGLVALQIADWERFSDADIDSIELLQNDFEKKLMQRVYYNDSISTYQWFLRSVDDSTTQVKVWITDEQHSFQQKIATPFVQNAFTKTNIKNASAIAEVLKETKKAFRVTPVSETTIPGTFYSYLTLDAKVDQKANVMVRNIYTIMSYIKEDSLKLKDDPFSEVVAWNREENTMQFHFSFPIAKDAVPPEIPEIQLGTRPEQKALHLSFRGNYRISHLSWYYLLQYAQRHGYKHNGKPIEYYRNDPHVTGGDPLSWEADIYLPLID
ncbi:GyrI-like domain-containing protein [Altibacter sp. HG106]|uniref:GyrI-like domain-containing protein n=1 Tax=Altibacter sp. HG106 TaxID=3023937 RepID=UPI0023500F6B|nr:GyrI-like domain-containing protein [Altibacter sp. HG106]MDC7994252.1 hypothetical protein [Altibacter sp. HG106]